MTSKDISILSGFIECTIFLSAGNIYDGGFPIILETSFDLTPLYIDVKVDYFFVNFDKSPLVNGVAWETLKDLSAVPLRELMPVI